MKCFIILAMFIVPVNLFGKLGEEPKVKSAKLLIEQNDFSNYKGKTLNSLLKDLNVLQESLWDHSLAMNYAVKRYKMSKKLELLIEIGMAGEVETVISAKLYKHLDKKFGHKLLDKKKWKILGLANEDLNGKAK